MMPRATTTLGAALTTAQAVPRNEPNRTVRFAELASVKAGSEAW